MYSLRMRAFSLMSLATLSVVIVFPGQLPEVLALKLTGWETLPSRDFSFQSNWSLPVQARSFYRIISNIDGDVYIGGNETLVKLSIEDGAVNILSITDLVTDEPTGTIVTCAVKYSTRSEEVCWNFIRIAEKRESDMLVCGTNAYNRRCYKCPTADLACVPLTAATLEFVPVLPEENPVATMIDQDNQKVVYGGNVDDQTFEQYLVKADDTITEELDTVIKGLGFIKKPTFVGKPFSYGNYVFLFYRESALEYASHGNKEYSRIARVCKNDTGGTVNTGKFVTFIKARLNCSLPDILFPFYYDEIQDVIWKNVPSGAPEAYAVFTSQSLGPKASALCRFKMDDIMNLFDGGHFKEQEGGDVNKQWLPANVVNPRPGTCNEVHQVEYPPLLDKLVPNYNPAEDTGGFQDTPPNDLPRSDPPTLYVDGVRFTSLAVDLDEGCVYYFGTESGTVIKAFKKDCNNASEEFKSVEINELETDGAAVNDVELMSKDNVKYLVITTDNNILTWRLNISCSARCEGECELSYPYCDWSVANKACECSTIWNSPDSCVSESAENALFIQPAVETIKACDYSDIYLYCQVDVGPCSDAIVNLTWSKADDPTFLSNSTHLVKCSRLSSQMSELKVTVHESSQGVYNCTAQVEGGAMVHKQVEVVQELCLTTNSLQERCDEYTELEKKHNAMANVGECLVELEGCDTCRIGVPVN